MIQFFKNKIILIAVVLSGLALLTAGLLIGLNYSRLGNELVLRFDSIKGVDLFGAKNNLLKIWFLGLAAVLLNFFLSKEFFEREKAIVYLLAITSAFIALLTLIISANIILNN